MSIEKNFESIAKSLLVIASSLEALLAARTTTGPLTGEQTPAVVQAAAAPVAQAPAQVVQAAAAPVAQLTAAPVVQAAAAPAVSFDAPAALPPINTPEEMNTHLVAEFTRLGAIHGEKARDLIVAKLQELGGSISVQAIAPAVYPAILAAVKAIV